ncbi:MAG: processive 1,2-diacylglycerol beta-glucosyltransferase [Candidatus Omnitrophota bacterium]|jgi:processive 1,2-diacylglycerol beta-glucosyltransferase
MKIAVIHATAGAGHLKAAEAVYYGLRKYTDHDVKIIDALDHTSGIFKSMYAGTYLFLIKHFPRVWGVSFAVIDIPALQPFIRWFRRIYNHINASNLEKLLIERQFDCIIMTHFMPTEITASLKRQRKINAKLITCVTDFDVHRIWLAEGVDGYCVASDWTKNRIQTLGIPENKVTVTGIPTNERFSAAYDVAELKSSMGLEKDRFTVLVATGSFGIGPIEEIIRELDEFQVVVVCGHNKTLFKTLTDKKYANAKVFGLVDNMHELMALSNAMVTKPGGLSISEALVTQLPLIFFNPIPGQETGNIKVLATYGVGISGCSIPDIACELDKLRTSQDVYSTVLMKTKEIARPFAVKDIVNLIT